jgi:hypothetical protein
MNLSILELVIYFLTMLGVYSQPPGWRMVDRFYGFRYEIGGNNIVVEGLPDAVQKQADLMGCFGWIQHSKKGTFVGEARCSKTQGPKFMEWLEKGLSDKNVENIQVHVYDDTKIRLHFAYFKIVEENRDTCFIDPPHKCDDINIKDSDDNNQHMKRDEL